MSTAPMKIYVAYLATDGGRDALTLGVMLARSLGAELAVGMVVPPDTGAALTAGDFEEVITDAADDWLADARHLIPDDVAVSTHIGIYDSTTEGIIVMSLVPTKALTSPPARVETISLGTPTGKVRIPAVAIEVLPLPPMLRMPSSLPSSCSLWTMTARPVAMVFMASSLWPPELSRARSPPPA